MPVGTKHSAPTTQPAPTVALSMITAFIPTSALAPMRAPCTIGPVPDVRPGLEHHHHAGEHVDRAVLLHVAAVLDHDAAPVAANGGPGPHVHVPADDHVARDRRLRMHERALVHDRDEAVELVDHSDVALAVRTRRRPYTRSRIMANPCPTPMHMVHSA